MDFHLIRSPILNSSTYGPEGCNRAHIFMARRKILVKAGRPKCSPAEPEWMISRSVAQIANRIDADQDFGTSRSRYGLFAQNSWSGSPSTQAFI